MGKTYIGQTINFKNRFNDHKSRLKNGKHFNKHLQNIWNKYGEDNIEFIPIEEVSIYSTLLQREKFYIEKVSTDTEETRAKIKEFNNRPEVKLAKSNAAKYQHFRERVSILIKIYCNIGFLIKYGLPLFKTKYNIMF